MSVVLGIMLALASILPFPFLLSLALPVLLEILPEFGSGLVLFLMRGVDCVALEQIL